MAKKAKTITATEQLPLTTEENERNERAQRCEKTVEELEQLISSWDAKGDQQVAFFKWRFKEHLEKTKKRNAELNLDFACFIIDMEKLAKEELKMFESRYETPSQFRRIISMCNLAFNGTTYDWF